MSRQRIENPDPFTAIKYLGYDNFPDLSNRFHAVQGASDVVHLGLETAAGWRTACKGFGYKIDREVNRPVSCGRCRKRARDLGITVKKAAS